jgi:hypothetical protein
VLRATLRELLPAAQEAMLTELADVLDGYDWSQGALRFAVADPLPRGLAARLVEVESGAAQLRGSIGPALRRT